MQESCSMSQQLNRFPPAPYLQYVHYGASVVVSIDMWSMSSESHIVKIPLSFMSHIYSLQ